MKRITCPNCNRKLEDGTKTCLCGMNLTFDKTRVQAFTKYLMDLSEACIIQTIKNVYINLKQGAIRTPSLGYNGAVEMAALLMLIKYSDNNPVAKNALQIAGKAAFTENVSPLAWTNYVDDIVAKTRVITENDWNDAFCYLKTYYFDDINTLEFA